MTICVNCKNSEATHNSDPLSEYGVDLCRACWRMRCDPSQGPKPRGPDWAEKNPEAAAHEAGYNQTRVIENAIGNGGRL